MRVALALIVLCVASPVLAQAPAAANGPAQLRVTVLDQTSAGIPAAVVTVTIAGAAPVKVVADEHGVATIPGLAAAAAQIHVEAAGFLAHDAQATLRRGTNTQTVTLAIEGFQEQVQVDDTAAAVQESGGAATTNVLDESVVEQLPDDPDELQAVLEQMAGGAHESRKTGTSRCSCSASMRATTSRCSASGVPRSLVPRPSSTW